ncbi:TMEM129 family protein [Megaselia abdita]
MEELETEIYFNLFFVLLSFVTVFPPHAFEFFGLTVETLFQSIIGPTATEKINFIRYHQKRILFTLAFYCLIPCTYFLFHLIYYGDKEVSGFWRFARSLCLFAVMFGFPMIYLHCVPNNWEKHNLSQKLSLFANTNGSYQDVASNISMEYRRSNILVIKMNITERLVATDNWIIKVSPLSLNFAHQSDTSLVLDKNETYKNPEDTSEIVQMLSIKVTSLRPEVKEFRIRINASEFENLQDRLSRPITISSDIQLHKTVMDRFIEVFKDQVSQNPTYATDLTADQCFACMISKPNVKIVKQCIDFDENSQPLEADRCCQNCYCRPMWCLDCLARWFASRQADDERDTWLQQKCSCPMCRSKFCVLDVCFLENEIS